jgi:cytoskeletal protein CcmA (bactofilin family)
MTMQNRRNLVVFTLALIVILLVASIARRWMLPPSVTPPRDVVLTQSYELSGPVDDSLVVVADTIRLNADSRVRGDAALIGRSSVQLDGVIDGDVTVMSDTLEIGKNSRINGDVSFMGSHINVEGGITGNLTAVGQAMVVGTESQITGTVTACVSALDETTALRPEQVHPCSENEALGLFAPLQTLRAGLNGMGIPAANLLWTLPAALALVALAALVVTALPRRFSRIEEAIRTAPGSFARGGCMLTLLALGLGGGLIALLALVPALGLVLLPIGLLLALVVAVMALVGWTTLALLLGNGLLNRQGSPALPPLVSVILGSFILCLLVYVLALVPFGVLVILIGVAGLAVLGLGAMFTTRFSRVRAQQEYAI